MILRTFLLRNHNFVLNVYSKLWMDEIWPWKRDFLRIQQMEKVLNPRVFPARTCAVSFFAQSGKDKSSSQVFQREKYLLDNELKFCEWNLPISFRWYLVLVGLVSRNFTNIYLWSVLEIHELGCNLKNISILANIYIYIS